MIERRALDPNVVGLNPATPSNMKKVIIIEGCILEKYTKMTGIFLVLPEQRETYIIRKHVKVWG